MESGKIVPGQINPVQQPGGGQHPPGFKPVPPSAPPAEPGYPGGRPSAPGYPPGGYPGSGQYPRPGQPGYPPSQYPGSGHGQPGYPSGQYPSPGHGQPGYPPGRYPTPGAGQPGYPYPPSGQYPGQGRPGYPSGNYPGQGYPGGQYPGHYPGGHYPGAQYPGSGGGYYPVYYPSAPKKPSGLLGQVLGGSGGLGGIGGRKKGHVFAPTHPFYGGVPVATAYGLQNTLKKKGIKSKDVAKVLGAVMLYKALRPRRRRWKPKFHGGYLGSSYYYGGPSYYYGGPRRYYGSNGRHYGSNGLYNATTLTNETLKEILENGTYIGNAKRKTIYFRFNFNCKLG